MAFRALSVPQQLALIFLRGAATAAGDPGAEADAVEQLFDRPPSPPLPLGPAGAEDQCGRSGGAVWTVVVSHEQRGLFFLRRVHSSTTGTRRACIALGVLFDIIISGDPPFVYRGTHSVYRGDPFVYRGDPFVYRGTHSSIGGTHSSILKVCCCCCCCCCCCLSVNSLLLQK